MKSLKWQKCYTGPYLITRKIQPVNYVLQKSERAKPFVVHLNKLKQRRGVGPAPEVLHSPVQTGVFDFSSDVVCDDSSPPVVQKLPGGIILDPNIYRIMFANSAQFS